MTDTSLPRRTTPPADGRPVVLYDGYCVFCTRQMKRLLRLVPRDAVTPLSFQDDGVLARFPGLTHDACMRAMVFVARDGRLFVGAEAVVRALGVRPLLRVAYVYYVPGIRWLCDRLYAAVARRRYQIAGKSGDCDGGTCSLHPPPA